MQYRNCVNQIKKELTSFKAEVDALEKEYLKEKEDQERKINSMHGKYTEEYIAELRTKKQYSKDYRLFLEKLKTDSLLNVDRYLEMIENRMNAFFMKPIDADFASRINCIVATGIQLSDREFEEIKKTVTNYMELRLLNQLAISRTRNGIQTTFDNQGNGKNESTKLSKPYNSITIPNLEKVYSAFESFQVNVRFMLNNYAGENAELSEFVGMDGTPKYLCLPANSFIRNNVADKFVEIMDKELEFIPEKSQKKALTENDKKMINSIIDPYVGSLASQRIPVICEYFPEFKELLRLDSRYSKYVED